MLFSKIHRGRAPRLYFLPQNGITRGLNAKKNYYSVLNVSQKADAAEIKKSFYALAKKYHPDVNKGNEDKFKEINEAYEILGDPTTKQEYDALRQAEATASASRSSSSSSSSSYSGSGGPRYQGTQQQNPFSQGAYSHQQQHYYQASANNTGRPQNPNFSEKVFQREEFLRDFLRKTYEAQGRSPNGGDYQQKNNNNSSTTSGYQNIKRDRVNPNEQEMNDAYQAYKMYQSKMQEEIRREQEYERYRKIKEVL